jgi:hypothetical protein
MQPTFTSTKAGYIVSMIATVWTLREIVREANAPLLPLPFVDAEFGATHAFGFLFICLGLAACFYGFTFLHHDEGVSMTGGTGRIGDFFYILSLCLLPFYLLALPAYLIARDALGVDFVNSHLARFMLLGTLPIMLVVGFTFMVAWRHMRAYARRKAIEHLETQEQEDLARANRNFSGRMFDQGVISYWDACVHRLQRSLLLHRRSVKLGNSRKSVQQAISEARHAGILSPAAEESVATLIAQVAVAKSKEMISAKDAETAKDAAKEILGRIPLDEPR